VFICPECRSVYLDQLQRCERDQEPLVPVQANQNVRTYPLLNQELDGRYHLIGGLGQGGVGTVYLANHIHLDQLSAVKFLDIDQLGQADEEQREETLSDFVKEAKLAMLLRHDSVVRVMDYGVFEGSPFLVMEYIPGPSLLRQLNSGQRFSIERCLQVIYKLADALNAFHERKLVHRDLKPANVIVDPRGNGALTLVDLGLVKDLSTEARSSTHPLALRGTPGYLAPEQVPSWVLSSAGVEVTSEKKRIDSRVDIYALGVLAYELLTGQTPYPKGLSATKVIIHACTQEPPPVEQLRPELRDYPGLAQLVKSMMAKTPEERPLDGREVMTRVDEILEDGQEPAALREELERAQSALARRMAVVSSGVPVHTPPPLQTSGEHKGRQSVSGALIAPPTSMTGAHQAIQLDEQLDQLLSSPQLTSPVPIEGVERQAPRLKHHEVELEAGLETQSEDSDDLPNMQVDAFADHLKTELGTLEATSSAQRHFQSDEATIAAYGGSSTPSASSPRVLLGLGIGLLLGGGALTWALLGSSTTPSTQPRVVRAQTASIPLPQPSSNRSLVRPAQVRATQPKVVQPFQPRIVTLPPQPTPEPTPSLVPSSSPSQPTAPALEVKPAPVSPSAQAARPAVKTKPQSRKSTQKSTQKRRKGRSTSSRRRAKRSAPSQKKSEYKTLSKSQMKTLMFQVHTDRESGDVDRARRRVLREMKQIDPKSPEYQTLNLLWNDLNPVR